MSLASDELEALLVLLGDESPEVAATARRRLLAAGPEVVEAIRNKLDSFSLRIRIRALQVVNWLETEPRSWELPSYVPDYGSRRFSGQDDFS